MKKSKRIIGSFLAAGIMVGAFAFNSEDADAGEAEYLQCMIDEMDFALGLNDSDFLELMASSGGSWGFILTATNKCVPLD